MTPTDRISGVIPVEELTLDPREVAARLHAAPGAAGAAEEECLALLRSAVACRYAARRVPVRREEDGRLDLGFGPFHSRDLTRNLGDSREAFVFAVTLGIGVDRLLQRLSLLSEARHFITDALSSAMAEAAADRAEALIRGELACRPRFSPGYGDLPLAIQPALLTALDAYRLLGVTLNRSLLMSPMKTVTAILGVRL